MNNQNQIMNADYKRNRINDLLDQLQEAIELLEAHKQQNATTTIVDNLRKDIRHIKDTIIELAGL